MHGAWQNALSQCSTDRESAPPADVGLHSIGFNGPEIDEGAMSNMLKVA
jgi:hypothetical protein